MSTDLPDYIEEPIRQKLCKTMDAVIATLPEGEAPNEVFISTSSTQSSRRYLGVWLFTLNLAVEIRTPLDRDRIQFEMFRFRNAVDWIRLRARKYKFEDPQDDSELDLEFTTKEGVSSELSADGKGCRHLMDIYRSQFLENFTGTTDEEK